MSRYNCLLLFFMSAFQIAAHAKKNNFYASIDCHYFYGGEEKIISINNQNKNGVIVTKVSDYYRTEIQISGLKKNKLRYQIYSTENNTNRIVHEGLYIIPNHQIKSEYGFTSLQKTYEPFSDAEYKYYCEMSAQKVVSHPKTEIKADHNITEWNHPNIDKQKRAEVRVNFVGDILLAWGVDKYISQKKDPFLDWQNVFSEADFNIANLESPYTLSESKMPLKPIVLKANPEHLQFIKKYFSAVSLANNHTGDYGHSGFVDTLNNLKKFNISYFGGGLNKQQAHQPYWIYKNNIKIAIIGLNHYKPRSFSAGLTTPGIAWADEDDIIEDIKQARKDGANIIIPFMHWGWESEVTPSVDQIKLARLMIENGADAIIGAHPHVTQGVSFIDNKPIVWSLGNFVFDGYDPGPERQGWMVQMVISAHHVKSIKIIKAHIDDMGIPKKE